MSNIKVGDYVARKSYGADTPFMVTNVIRSQGQKPVYMIRGLVYRILADADDEDLIKQDSRIVLSTIQKSIREVKNHQPMTRYAGRMFWFNRFRSRPGRILHIDSSEDYLKKCIKLYGDSGLRPIGKIADENSQPEVVRGLLEQYKPDILVLTGHDGLKKDRPANSIDSYSNSRYFIQAVREARKYEPSADKLCIFAGACQSYYEAIMAEGANFASSPGRILIHALDPAIVSEKVALTDNKAMVTPNQIAELTNSGSKGIWGKDTKGRLLTR